MSIAANISTDTQRFFKSRKAAISNHPSIFTDIFEDDTNIAIWQRDLSVDIESCVDKFLESHNNFQASLIASPEKIFNKLIDTESELINAKALCKDIAELVEMFCLLLDFEQVGLRLAVLDRAMCPRFHVDMVPSRLVCTYHGVASEWLPHDKIDRSKLGRGNNGLVDEESGIFQSTQDINQLKVGDVAILKGELWQGNAGAGLVHRSPQVPAGKNRLLLTLDFQS